MKSKVLAFVVSSIIGLEVYGSGTEEFILDTDSSPKIKGHIHKHKNGQRSVSVTLSDGSSEYSDVLEFFADLDVVFDSPTESPVVSRSPSPVPTAYDEDAQNSLSASTILAVTPPPADDVDTTTTPTNALVINDPALVTSAPTTPTLVVTTYPIPTPDASVVTLDLIETPDVSVVVTEDVAETLDVPVVTEDVAETPDVPVVTENVVETLDTSISESDL